MLQIDQSQAGCTVQVAVGAAFEVRLPENPTTGFRWHIRSDGTPFCTRLDDHFEAPAEVPGCGGVHSWRFHASQPGQGKIEFVYQRQWEQKAGQDFHVFIEIKP